MTWKFVQEGPNARTPLQLEGWQQPFGRPRQGEVVDIGVKVERSITRLGGNVDPIINAFTTYGRDWHMHGRWMDRVMGKGSGAALHACTLWKDFVSDRRIIQASWDNLIAYRIFIHDMPMKVESPGEVAWEMLADVVTDLSMSTSKVTWTVSTPKKTVSECSFLVDKIDKPWTDPLGPLAWALAAFPDAALALGIAQSAIRAPFNLVSQLAGQMTDFTSASQTDLKSLAGGVGQVQTAVIGFRATTDDTVAAAIALQAQYTGSPAYGQQPIFSAPDMIALQSAKIESDQAATALLALLAEILAQVQFYLRGSTSTAYAAIDGDTWESIALRTLGAIDAAAKIRDLNGITGGAQPVPSKQYQIPTST